MSDRLFELNGQWIGREAGTPNLYRYWYDGGNAAVRRRSLGTQDLEEAKLKLAAIVVQGTAAQTTRSAPDVLLAAVGDHYLEHKAPATANPYNARRAFELLYEYIFVHRKMTNVRVDAFTLSLQLDFMQWCVSTRNHAVGGIQRNMNAIRAAFNFAASDQMIIVDGQRKEVRLLDTAPTVKTNKRWIAKHAGARESKPREWIPSYEQLASLLDYPAPDYLGRYDIMALYTWARPEALWELNVDSQVDYVTGLVDLNPAGRSQTNKRRPSIKLCDGLAGWLKVWDRSHPMRGSTATFTGCKTASAVTTAFKRRTNRWRMSQAGYSEAEIDHIEGLTHPRHKELSRDQRWAPHRDALEKAEEMGIGQISPYTLRHFMATRTRSLEDVMVSREQRKAWLGHVESDTTAWYESFDPEFLREVAIATGLVVARLDDMTERRLVPKSVKQRGLRVVGGRGV